tara:strand:- start:11657 stop:12799 length:1143 start_codon:yes stop_codon:yes gene_type:complete
MSDKINSTVNLVKDKFTNTVKTMANVDRNKKVQFITIIIIVCLLITIIYYIHSKVNLLKTNCKNLRKIYNSTPSLSPIPSDTNYLLRDFYIKTAYNACATGQFKNDYVGLCALRTCINQGARCLDFEIYSVNDQPVVAVSSIKDFTVKESFNSLSTAKVFQMINNLAFSGTNCPNPGDPLILHFRILSENVAIYNILANQIATYLSDRILGVNYSFENNGHNLGAVPIKKFLGKIIIIADASNPLFRKTKLDEYINMSSGSPFMRIMHYGNLKNTQDLTLTNFNKQHMSIVLPDWSNYDNNPNFNIARQYGCQLIGMSYQNFDSNLEHYNAFFDGERTAFVLKPAKLRYIPVTVKVPNKPPESYSYQNRAVTSNYYDYTI